MKTLLQIILFTLFPFLLAAQNKIDKKVATMEIIKGFLDEYDMEANKKYLSPNVKVVWPAGNAWPNGNGTQFDRFWSFFKNSAKNLKSELPKIEIKESGNETYAFFVWKSTYRENKDPELVGTTSVGPLAHRMIWEDNQIVEWQIFFDDNKRKQQHIKEAKAKKIADINLTADQLFEKVINYYDPSAKWSSFSGSMHIQTIDGNWIGDEDLTIDNTKDYYRSIKYLPEGEFTKGVEKGDVFFSAMGEAFNPDQVPEKYQKGPYGLNESAIKMMKDHHIGHFSLPLSLHAEGVKPLAEIDVETLFGKKCLTIKFEGLPNAYEHSMLLKYPITLYIDPTNNFRLHAYKVDNNWGKAKKGGIVLFSGEIEIGGIKIPSRKLYYEFPDLDYSFIDVFTIETRLEEKKNY